MISSPFRFEQPCGEKRERETARTAAAVIRHLIRIYHLFTTGFIKPTELLIIFQNKQENEFI